MAMSNAVQLMRHHKHDWIMVLLLMGIAGILSILPPFNRFIGKNMLEDLTYPYKEETIPFWIVQIIAVGIPPIIFLTYFFHRKDVNDLHNSILGLLFSIFTTVVISDTMKDAVGRPRPDFFWRCFPDGTPKFDNVTGEVVCHGNPKIIREGHKSFPSGHTSWAFSGLGFLSLYLAAKIQLFDNKGHPVKLTIVFLPLLVGTLIAISRVDDYRHHWQDVFAGAFLGLTMATLCYRQFFPAPYEPNAAVPFHCYAMLTGQASVTECDVAVNLENGQYYRLATEESVYENQ